jgi:EthD domain
MALRVIWQFCVIPPPCGRSELLLEQERVLDTVPPLRPILGIKREPTMEKIICALWGSDPRQLIDHLAAALFRCGATQVRINVPDESVAPGAALIQRWQDPQQDAVVQFWLPSANPIFTGPAFEAIAARCERFAAWLVAESTIIPSAKHPPAPGDRSEGWAQMAFLTLPKRLAWAEWRKVWRDIHTKVAIDTQANFEYVQNLVVEPLTADAPPYIAIVEECFPLAALTDPQEFFDAVGDSEKFDRNLAAMMESCNRFIDFGTIDVIPTSQFNFA